MAVELETAVERAPMVLPELKSAAREASFSAIDALAAVAKDGSLLLSIVHRGSAGMVSLTVDLQDFKSSKAAEVRTLTAEVPWAVNTLEKPETVKPKDSTTPVRNGQLELKLAPYTFARVRIPPS